MADFNQPELTSLYADMVNVLKDRDASALKWLDGTTDSNIPSGAKRWNATNNYFEKFNGSTWSVLTAKYMIDVDKLDGCTVNDLGTSTTDLWTASKVTTALSTKLDASAYTAADVLTKIKTVDGSASGLDADLLDGLHASSANTVSTVVARDASGNFSAGTITANLTGTASTATTLTGLTSTVAELNFSDGVTSNIQTQLDSKLTSASSLAGNNIVWSTTSTAGKFDTSTTTPTGSTRLNYNGYLYPTYINLSASADTAVAATNYFVETGSDGFVRPKTLANVKAEITTGLAPLASPALTGTPTAPTAVAGTNTTQIATTAFVLANSDTTRVFTAGTKLEVESLAVSYNLGTLAKVKEACVGAGGTITVYFTAYSDSSGSARIYKNGVAVGTNRTFTTSVNYTENITVAAGDLVQIYATAAYISNFRILVAEPQTSNITYSK